MPEPLQRLRRSFACGLACSAALAGVFLPTSTHAAPYLDAPFHPFTVGEHLRSIACADLNHDGWPDLAATSQYSNTVSVLIAIGNGDFLPPAEYPVAGLPDEIAIGDVTRDGVPDLVVISTQPGSFKVLAGFGDGSFAPAVDHVTGAPPLHVAIADLNHDGFADVVVGCGSFTAAAAVQVFLGDAGGALAPQAVLSLLWPTPVGFAVGDVNGDGNADVVTAHGVLQATVTVALGRGDGTFNPPTAFFDSPLLTTLALADIDGDGRLDLVLGGSGPPDRVGVRLGAGNGSFGPSIDYSLGAYSRPVAFAVADLDRDGRRDVVAVLGGLLFLPGLGNGHFGPSTPLNCSGSAGSIATGDLDDDGIPDLAVAGTFNGSSGTRDAVSVIFGDGFGGSRGPVVRSGVGCVSVDAGDLNGDGIPDLVTANFDGHSVSTLLGVGGLHFATALTFSPGGTPWRAALGDLNGDHLPDLVLTYTGDSIALSVQDGLGNGTFGPRRDYVRNPNLTGESFAAIADFNANGKPDLAMVNRYTNTLSILLGQGNGTFPARVDYGTGFEPTWIAIADVNRDGRSDVIVAHLGTSPAAGVACHIGRGDGTFLAPVYYPTGPSPICVAAGDLNGDGWPDLVTRNTGTNTVSVLLNNRAGAFPAHVEYPTVWGGWWVGIGRLDGDAVPDVIVGNSFGYGNTMTTFHGVGDGSFVDPRDYGIGTSPYTAVVADLDQDGFLDVAAANRGTSNVGILRHRVDIPVAATVSLIGVEANPDRVRLTWSAGAERSLTAEVQRRWPDGPWTALALVMSDGSGRLEFEDHGATAGESYDYRLVAPGPDGPVLAAPVRVTIPAAYRLGLEPPGPNPVVGTGFVAWVTLPSATTATLELLDLAGRRVESHELGGLGAGHMSVAMGRGQPLPPGVYLLRLRSADRSLVARVALLR